MSSTPHAYRVRRSDRARRARLTVSREGEVVVVLPRRMPAAEAVLAPRGLVGDRLGKREPRRHAMLLERHDAVPYPDVLRRWARRA